MIFLGKIIKIRGNKGEVVVAPSLDLYAQDLKKGEGVVLKSTKYTKEKEVDYVKEIRGAPVFKFKDTNTINDAFRLVGYSIYTKKTDTQKTATSVVNFLVNDMDGDFWGCVTDIDTSGLNRLLEVEAPGGDIIYVPFTDTIVKKIDEEKKIILIDPPDGLRDLNKS